MNWTVNTEIRYKRKLAPSNYMSLYIYKIIMYQIMLYQYLFWGFTGASLSFYFYFRDWRVNPQE